MLYVADFETITNKNDCRVWAWAQCEVVNENNIQVGNNIDTLINKWKESNTNDTVYFHNLKFDGEFIIYWLFHHGFKHSQEKKINAGEFKTLISDMGMFYSIEICFEREGKKLHKVTLLDSLKVLPLPVEKIAKAFNLEISKLSIDYDAYREVGHELTKEETAYVQNDVKIVAQALRILFSQNLNKMTTAANAMNDYKEIVGKKKFERMFPVPEYDADIRQAYHGGFTYLVPRYKEKDVGAGIVLDVNSLYPSVMYYRPLPYGEGIAFNGKYQPDEMYNLYVQMFTCQFELKPNHIPCIQIKHSLSFVANEWLESSNGEAVTMCLTSVDLDLFFEHYEVYDITYHSGWKFRSATGMFKDYIDKWNAVKVEATKTGNSGLRTIAKLMLNSLYGKFAVSPTVRSKIPVLSPDDTIKYVTTEPDERSPIYIPVGCFITAWARYKTITSAQKVYDRFIYADTDSLHLEGLEVPSELDISPTELGAWKHESSFTRARFLRQKSYIEDENGELKITCTGMPKGCYPYVTWENFHTGASYDGKLRPIHTQGGIVFENTPMTLRG